ncbi:MAG: hypothetical protein V3W28_05690 [Thermoplasmata archaeon]
MAKGKRSSKGAKRGGAHGKEGKRAQRGIPGDEDADGHEGLRIGPSLEKAEVVEDVAEEDYGEDAQSAHDQCLFVHTLVAKAENEEEDREPTEPVEQ